VYEHNIYRWAAEVLSGMHAVTPAKARAAADGKALV